MKELITLKDVEECAASGWTIKDTAEELGVTYDAVYRYLKKHNLQHLFPHGNAKTNDRL